MARGESRETKKKKKTKEGEWKKVSGQMWGKRSHSRRYLEAKAPGTYH